MNIGRQEAKLIEELDLDESGNFIVLRRKARAALATGSHAEEIDEIVTELLGA